MKKIISALIRRPRSLHSTVVNPEVLPAIPCTPSKSLSSSSSRTKRFAPDPANPQSKLFFHRWLDTWKTQNGGDHGPSR